MFIIIFLSIIIAFLIKESLLCKIIYLYIFNMANIYIVIYIYILALYFSLFYIIIFSIIS